jgi:GT2 family glycosyltransferase
MSVLLAVAVFDTIENNRTWMTRETLLSLQRTVDLNKHRLFVIDNASCQATKDLLNEFKLIMPFTLITNEENVGTARAINQAWKHRLPGEELGKIDNDVVIHQSGWVDIIEEAISRASDQLGIVCLKRRDLDERPYHPEGSWAKSYLHMLPQEKGQRCIIIEEVKHAMGTCQIYNSKLIDKIGGLYQFSQYSFDDSLAGVRAEKAGFLSCFIPYIDISHVDPGGTEYTQWKSDHAGELMEEFNRVRAGYKDGSIDIYHPL